MIPFYEWFNRVLLMSANSVPIQSLWTAFFTNPLDLNRALQAGTYENLGPFLNLGSLAGGAAINTAQGANGALFANSVTIPGDGLNVSKTGPEGSGLIKGNISSGRKDMENLVISFLDTNMSFTDYNLRPWAIYANHKSLKDTTVKTTITVIQWTKTGPEKALLPRAIWTFHDACPVSISSEEWNYGGDNVVSRQVEFAYNFYALNADPGITALQTVASIVDPSELEQKYQPVEVPTGGLESHSGGQPVSINPDDNTKADGHPEGQPVVIPEDDIIARGINIGLDILNGNSNVSIAADDVVDRLRSQGEELQRLVKVPEDDVPERNKGKGQLGHVYKEPVGPEEGLPDHITRRQPTREQSGSIPVGGNSKDNAKALADTPLFFPNDGEENSVKIGGRTVDGELDTPEIQTLRTQEVVVPVNGDVGRNIPLQIVTINRDDVAGGANRENQSVTVQRNDMIDGNINAQIVNIDMDDNVKEGMVPSQFIDVDKEDEPTASQINQRIVTVDEDDRIRR